MSRRSDPGRTTVLVVEDEPELLEIYGDWLAESYDVRRAANGLTALELMDDAVDVVLLDRKMPDMSGDEVLARVREAGYDCTVAMVTAVQPALDITEMGFDDYVQKPVTYEELHDVVRRLLDRGSYNERVKEYFAVVSKLVALNAADEDVEDSERYRALARRKRELRRELDEASEGFDPEDYEATMKGFEQLDVWEE